MRTITEKPGSFGSKAAHLAGSDRSGSAEGGTPRVPRAGFVTRAIVDLAKAFWAVLVRWQEREEMRNHLMDIDDRILRDVGLTRREVMREIEKPFWRQ